MTRDEIVAALVLQASSATAEAEMGAGRVGRFTDQLSAAAAIGIAGNVAFAEVEMVFRHAAMTRSVDAEGQSGWTRIE